MFHKVIIPSLTLATLIAFAAPTLAVETPEAPSDALPDAMQHLVKAPEVDIQELRDPFVSYLTTLAIRGQRLIDELQSKQAGRTRQPLEAFDLSTLTLTGIFSMGEKRVAMIQDNQGKGYTVTRGDYMGKHAGLVEKIDVDTLYLTEQIANPAGDIVEHQVTLTLKEVNQ